MRSCEWNIPSGCRCAQNIPFRANPGWDLEGRLGRLAVAPVRRSDGTPTQPGRNPPTTATRTSERWLGSGRTSWLVGTAKVLPKWAAAPWPLCAKGIAPGPGCRAGLDALVPTNRPSLQEALGVWRGVSNTTRHGASRIGARFTREDLHTCITGRRSRCTNWHPTRISRRKPLGNGHGTAATDAFVRSECAIAVSLTLARERTPVPRRFRKTSPSCPGQIVGAAHSMAGLSRWTGRDVGDLEGGLHATVAANFALVHGNWC